MKSLMTFLGILASSFPISASATSFSCPVSASVAGFTCAGTVKVKTLAELNAYVNNLGIVAKKPTIAKNLQIDFNADLSSNLSVSTPCTIKIPAGITITSTANICLHGAKGVAISENFNFTGKNLLLESKEEVIIGKDSVLKALDIQLLSIGVGDASKTYIRDNANIEASNLIIESFDKGFIGKNSIVKLSGSLGIYSLGDDEASVREGAQVEASKIEISSIEETRVAKSTTLIADQVILNGTKCVINKTAIITAEDRLGNCFLTSTTNKAKFSISKNQGKTPLLVNFNASSIVDAKGFVWSFGDGTVLNSLSANVSHTYDRVGSFTATLKYATKDNYKGLKSAGAIQIDVKAETLSAPIPPAGYFNYIHDDTFLILKAFIKKTQADIASAYYVINDDQSNKIQIPNFYPNAISNIELGSYGRHKVTMNVTDVNGNTYTKTNNVFLVEDDADMFPVVRLSAKQSAPRTMFFNMSSSFIPSEEENLRTFTIDYGDGQIEEVEDATTITHTYAAPGTYAVRVTANFNGNVGYDEASVVVTDAQTPILNPVAGFEYHIYDYAGNVVFADDRSGTPNGKIISYAWDFGDGTVAYGKNASNFYAPGEYLVSLTVTDTAGMRDTQVQKITVVEEGDDIASMLDCWNDGDRHLGCDVVAFDKFKELTRVRIEWGDGKMDNMLIADFPNTGFSTREHIYEEYGTYNVVLKIDTVRGQSKRLYHSITYEQEVPPIEEPEENLMIAKFFCNNYFMRGGCYANESFSPAAPIVLYRFEIDNGTVIENTTGVMNYTFIEHREYEIKLIVKNSLNQTSTATTKIQTDIPVPSASVNCSTSYLLVQCNALGASDPINSDLFYEYDMGDGNVISSLSGIISHSYAESGLYQVKMKVFNLYGGFSHSETSAQALLPPSNVAPIISPNCFSDKPHTINCLLGTSYDPDGTISSYSILFEGSYVTQASSVFTYVFSSGGEKEIFLKLTDDMGKESHMSLNVIIQNNNLPSVDFICSSAKVNEVECQSIADAGDNGDKIIEYEWSMNDGSQNKKGNIPTVAHFFAVGGVHSIGLSVKDMYGGISFIQRDVIVKENRAPLASFNCENLSAPLNSAGTYTCIGSHSDDGQVVEAYYLINGKRLDGEVIKYDFLNGGSNLVEYVVKDDTGLITKVVGFVNINNVPRVEFDCISNEAYRISCTALELPEWIKAISYAFIVENDDLISTKELDYEFHNSGLKSIKLLVLLSDGREVISEKFFMVEKNYQLPKAQFNSYVDINKKVSFNAINSYLGDRGVLSFSWNFGDGTLAVVNNEEVEHIFPAYGSYTVSLTVTDKNAQTNTVSRILHVYAQDVADPGELNDVTVEGIDSDGDLIRDDIQRWIAYESREDTELGFYLKKLARSYSAQVTNRSNKTLVQLQESVKHNIERCIKGKLNDDEKSKYYLEMLEFLHTATQLRSQAWIEVQSALSGSSYKVDQDFELLSACSNI